MEKKKLCIGIDATCLTPHITGISCYVFNLITVLSLLDEDNAYIVFVRRKDLPEWRSRISKPNFRFIPCRFLGHWPQIIWRLLILPFHLRRFKVDVFHTQNYFSPFFKGRWRSIVTIHDLIFFTIPYLYNRFRRLFLKWITLQSIYKADRIITVSNNTKEDVINVAGIQPDKIDAVLSAQSGFFKPIRDKVMLGNIKTYYKTSDNFILFAGELRKRKNIVGLIKAYYLFQQKIKQKYRLVLVGTRLRQNVKTILNTVRDFDLGDKVIFTGQVSQEDLLLLYNAAKLFVYVPLYEGFGFPVLEAMSCGVPVVASNISSIPEIAGDAARLVDPYKVEEIALALYEIITNSALRASMVKKGFEVAKRFSWERTAQETLAVYKTVSATDEKK